MPKKRLPALITTAALLVSLCAPSAPGQKTAEFNTDSERGSERVSKTSSVDEARTADTNSAVLARPGFRSDAKPITQGFFMLMPLSSIGSGEAPVQSLSAYGNSLFTRRSRFSSSSLTSSGVAGGLSAFSRKAADSFAGFNPIETNPVKRAEVSQAQAPPGSPSGNDAADLATRLSNPVASLISIPIQTNCDWGMGPLEHGFRFTMNIQPVIPFELNDNWNLISRTILPVIHQNDVVAEGSSETIFGPGRAR
jgi:hypothetical protein